MQLLMYGAGSIGRGFIAPLFSQAGYEVVFVDINRDLVDALNTAGRYRLRIAADRSSTQEISGVRAVDGRDEAAVHRLIADCDIMATALGAAALRQVSPLLARGLALRADRGGEPLNVLICENLHNAAETLWSWLADTLPETRLAAVRGTTRLVETAIGRMVPTACGAAAAVPGTGILDVSAEEYDFLPLDQAAFCGALPDIPQLVPYTPFAYFSDRKLYLHNMGHAVCGYLGLLQMIPTIWQAISEPCIRLLVQDAMLESSAMLSQRFHIPFQVLYTHAEDLQLRFQNRALGDTCERVARDPMRKLAAEDRLAGPYRLGWECGLAPISIGAGIAAALVTLDLKEHSAAVLLRDTSGLDSAMARPVLDLYRVLRSGGDLSQCLRTVEEIKRKLRGKIV